MKEFLGKNILIIDDDPNLRDNLCNILSDKGFICFEAKNGTEALKKVESESYDLILLDLMLPQMNGIEVLEKKAEKTNEFMEEVLTKVKELEMDFRRIYSTALLMVCSADHPCQSNL